MICDGVVCICAYSTSVSTCWVLPAGELVLTMMAGLAKFERDLLRERQRRGIEAARKRGEHLGRPPAQTPGQAETAIVLLQTESLAVIASEW